jgi:hypothetical protein
LRQNSHAPRVHHDPGNRIYKATWAHAFLLAIMRYKVLVPEVIERMTASRGVRPTADEEPKHARLAAQAIRPWPRLVLYGVSGDQKLYVNGQGKIGG